MKHLSEGGTNVYIHVYNQGHMTQMSVMPIYGKNPSKIFFSDCNETWHEASMTQVLQCIYKSWPCDDLGHLNE